MTENLLGENPPVEYLANTLTPDLISEQIWVHLFLHYWQMFTEGRLKRNMCLTSRCYHQVSIRGHQNIPKETRRTETLHCWWGNTMASLVFNCTSNCGSCSWISVCCIHLFNLLKSHVERTSSECFYTFTVAGKNISLKSTCSIYPSHFEPGLLKGKFSAWHWEWKNREKSLLTH